jgi:hypothetical protein
VRRGSAKYTDVEYYLSTGLPRQSVDHDGLNHERDEQSGVDAAYMRDVGKPTVGFTLYIFTCQTPHRHTFVVGLHYSQHALMEQVNQDSGKANDVKYLHSYGIIKSNVITAASDGFAMDQT